MSMQLPNTTAPRLPEQPLVALTARQERYARAVAAGQSFSEAFEAAGLRAASASSRSTQIRQLNATPKVRQRIKELRDKLDAETVSTIADRMAWLRLIVTADPSELTRVVHEPCGSCWTDELITAAYADYLVPPGELGERPPLPNPAKPRHDCKHCNGQGYARVVMTPTDELSPEGRALFKGASQNDKGVIEIEMHDQIAAADMLNKLQSAYISKSLNLNANVSVAPARDVSGEDALKLFEAFKAPA